MADQPAVQYRNSTPDSIPTSYFDKWSPLVGGWWLTGDQASGYATHLFAEILYKIKTEYEDADPSVTNPFDAGVDALFFVFLSNSSLYSDDVGGHPVIHVNAGAVNDSTSFYQGLVRSNGGTGTTFAGTGQEMNTMDEYPHTQLDIGKLVYVMAHEFGHVLGPGDGPPNLGIASPESEEWYLYGNLNLMCQHAIRGSVPFAQKSFISFWSCPL